MVIRHRIDEILKSEWARLSWRSDNIKAQEEQGARTGQRRPLKGRDYQMPGKAWVWQGKARRSVKAQRSKVKVKALTRGVAFDFSFRFHL